MKIYTELVNGEREPIGDLEVFARIVKALEDQDLMEAAWDWKAFAEKLSAATVVVGQLGGTEVVDDPRGVRFYVEGVKHV